MDLLDRMLVHDRWANETLLELCRDLTDADNILTGCGLWMRPDAAPVDLRARVSHRHQPARRIRPRLPG